MDDQSAHKPALLRRTRRVVVKLGSSILSTTRGIHRERLKRIVDEIQAVRSERRELVIVTSGAVAAGLARLGLERRPKSMPQKQAAAAVGQISLMALYEEYFAAHDQHVAQILVTHDDLANRRRYLNARHTFAELLRAGIVPIVNENDTVAVEEMKARMGDNDNLSALVATLIDADLLVILSDVAGLYTANPHVDSSASLVPLVPAITSKLRDAVSGPQSAVGTGGMASKLNAAHKATQAGIPCVVADGLNAGVLAGIFDPRANTGTLFLAHGDRLGKRKHWIAHTLRTAGAIRLDAGACEALRQKGRSLLPKGVVGVSGSFGAGDCVACVAPDGEEIARGLVAYSSIELDRIKGLHSNAIEAALGYKPGDEVIHRDDLVLIG